MTAEFDRVSRLAHDLVALTDKDKPKGTEIEIGMRADAVLLLPGRGADQATRKPTRDSLAVRTYYRDCTIVFHYLAGHWRVAAVEPAAEVEHAVPE